MKLSHMFGAAAMVAVFGAGTAQASVLVSGDTIGCFGNSCSTIASGNQKAKSAKDGTLSFSGTAFSHVLNDSGPLDLKLGKFTLEPGFFEPFFNDPFKLEVQFSSPVNDSATLVADVTGLVTIIAGIVHIDFNPDTVKFGNDLYTLTVDDVTLGTLGPFGSSRNLEGAISMTAAVPEPATWAMIVIGFAALGFCAHRRKSIAATVAAA